MYIEDYLEILVGIRDDKDFQIEKSDYNILTSIARQVFKGVGLTDRQHSLVKEKLLYYKDQFFNNEFNNLEFDLDNLKIPLREINRSKYIKFVDHLEVIGSKQVYESYKADWVWIKVRFPFSKKLIVLIEGLKHDGQYHHAKGSHEHFYRATEQNIYAVVNAFIDKNFTIDSEVLSYYKELELMHNNKENYIPGIYNFKLKNLSDRAMKYMINSIGKPSNETLALYNDRKDQFGLVHFDKEDLESSINNLNTLSSKIVKRKKNHVFVNSKEYTFNQLTETFFELNRMPLLVVLPVMEPINALHTVHTNFKNLLMPHSSSVLFRLSNDSEGLEFNSYIKENSLNNILDKDTKIVYTDSSKIPKPLVKSDWKPSAILLMSSQRPQTKVLHYIESADLIVHYDSGEPSRFLLREIEII